MNSQQRESPTDPDFVSRLSPCKGADWPKVFSGLLCSLYSIESAEYTELNGYDDLNFKITDSFTNTFTLKLINPWESQFYPALCEAQAELAELVAKKGIDCPQLVRTLDGSAYGSVGWNPLGPEDQVDSKFPADQNIIPSKTPILLRTFVPGIPLGDWVSSSPKECNLDQLSTQIGALLGRFHAICDHRQCWPSVFRHYAPLLALEHWHFHRREFELQRRELGEEMVSRKRAELCQKVFDEFEQKVMGNRDQFEQGLIHGDFNESNILIRCGSDVETKISALIDFGDTHFSFRIADLANAILYLYLLWREMAQIGNDQGGKLLREIAKSLNGAYSKCLAKCLPTFDLSHLGLFVRARLMISLVNGLRALRMSGKERRLAEDGLEYVLKTQQIGQKVLEELCNANMDDLIGNSGNANKKKDNISEANGQINHHLL